MAQELLVGIDMGTTSAKAGVVGLDGRELSWGRARMPWHQRQSGADMDPAELLTTAVAAVEAALDGAPDGPILGLGVASMAETGVLADADGEPLTPAIAWYDTRGEEGVRRLEQTLGRREFNRRTGLELGALCTAAKYQWLRDNVPATRRGRRWFNVAEWVVAGFGGRPGTELSLASRTGWLDLSTRDWWPEALDASGTHVDLLAPLHTGDAPQGAVTRGPRRLHGATLAVCGHDHLCGSVGVGVLQAGEVFDSSGTAEAFIAPLAKPPGPDAVEQAVAAGVNVGWHTLPERCSALGAQRAGLVLQRVLDLLGVTRDHRDALDDAALVADPRALRWEGLEDELATLSGIGWGAGPPALWRAALDQTADRSAALLKAIQEVAGPTRRLVVGGGWARSRAVRETKAARLGAFDHADVREPGVRGAALLSGVAAGLYDGVAALPPPQLGGQSEAGGTRP